MPSFLGIEGRDIRSRMESALVATIDVSAKNIWFKYIQTAIQNIIGHN